MHLLFLCRFMHARLKLEIEIVHVFSGDEAGNRGDAFVDEGVEFGGGGGGVEGAGEGAGEGFGDEGMGVGEFVLVFRK